jgi:hypothetical protein
MPSINSGSGCAATPFDKLRVTEEGGEGRIVAMKNHRAQAGSR